PFHYGQNRRTTATYSIEQRCHAKQIKGGKAKSSSVILSPSSLPSLLRALAASRDISSLCTPAKTQRSTKKNAGSRGLTSPARDEACHLPRRAQCANVSLFTCASARDALA